MSNNSANAHRYCPINYTDQERGTGITSGEWRNEENDILGLQPLGRVGSNNYSLDASLVRQGFKEYFNSEGAVNWQWELVTASVTRYDRFLDRLQLLTN
jgi:hypothetical protein